jgi:hypothetical protein
MVCTGWLGGAPGGDEGSRRGGSGWVALHAAVRCSILDGWRVLWPGGGEDGLVVHQAAVRAAGVQGLAL